MDDYIEHMTKGKQPAYWTVLLVIAGALSVLSLLFAFYNVFGILLFIAVSLGTYVVWLFSKVEYEYTYVGGGFTMDQILNKTRRRQLVDTNASELIVLAPCRAPEREGHRLCRRLSGRSEVRLCIQPCGAEDLHVYRSDRCTAARGEKMYTAEGKTELIFG